MAGESGFLSALGGLGGAISAGSSILGGISGLIQAGKAKRMRRDAERFNPGVTGYQKVANEAEQAAREGMGAQEYNLATTGIQRGTQSALRQLGRMSNPIAAIGQTQQIQNDALAKLNATNSQIRRQNKLQSWQATRDLNNAQLQQYQDKINQANALLGAGNQNVAGALGSLGQMGLYQSLYGQNNIGNSGNKLNNALNRVNTQSRTGLFSPIGAPTNIPG